MAILQKYYYNNDTSEIINYDDFVNRCKKYKEEYNSTSTIHEIMDNDDDVIYIGKFASIKEARKYFDEEF